MVLKRRKKNIINLLIWLASFLLQSSEIFYTTIWKKGIYPLKSHSKLYLKIGGKNKPNDIQNMRTRNLKNNQYLITLQVGLKEDLMVIITGGNSWIFIRLNLALEFPFQNNFFKKLINKVDLEYGHFFWTGSKWKL